MDNNTIQQYLAKDLREIAYRLQIPDDFLASHTDLCELIIRSKSMDKDEEKQSWFNLLPMMNQDQILKLYDILTREKVKLAEIEKKYESKKAEIKQKYLEKRQSVDYVQKVDAIKTKEDQYRQKEVEEADALLAGL